MLRSRAFLILLLFILLPIVVGGCGRKSPLPEYYREPFPTPSGKQIRIMDLNARIVLLFFWTTDCDPCSSMESRIRKTASLLPGHVAILGVNTDTGEPMEDSSEIPGADVATQETKEPSLTTYRFNGDTILDPEFQLVQELQVETAPALAVLYDDGEEIHVQRYYNLERMDAKTLADAIQKKMKEK